VCARHRFEQRLIGFARRSRPAVDYESKLNERCVFATAAISKF
jgi:hypothetical protein